MVNVLIIIILIIVITIMVGSRQSCHKKSRKHMHQSYYHSHENDTLNDVDADKQMGRDATYDDTARINNQMFWMSDYSHSQYDTGKSLNDDILTPIRPVSGSNAMNYYGNMHNVTRFGCEKS